MTISLLIFRQLCIMFLYLLVGFALYRGKIITAAGSKELASLLVYLIIPAVIIKSFCTARTAQTLSALGISAAVGILLLAVSMLIARFLFRNRPIEHFAAAFSNAGFMGIPLIQAALGDAALLYIVPFIAVLNLLQWTYGADVLRQDHAKMNLRGILLNPIMLGTAIGLLLFLTGLGTRLPDVLGTALNGVCAMNTPLAMLVLGMYLAKEKLLTLFTRKGLYAVSAVRLLLIPAVSALVLFVLPIDSTIKYAILIAAACPVGANVAVYAQLYDKDYAYASQTVVLSTLLSILSLPLIVLLGGAVCR